MKKLTIVLFLTFSLGPFANTGRTAAVETFLNDEFLSVSSYSSFWELPSNDKCDEVLSVIVQGNRGSGSTSFDCTICLLNEGGLMVADRQNSECHRESH